MIILTVGPCLLSQAHAPLDQLLRLGRCHAGVYETIHRSLVGGRRGHLSTCGEIGQVRLDDRVRILMEQPRRPQGGVKLVTLGLKLGCQTAVQYDRTRLKCIAERGDHQPNLASSAQIACAFAGTMQISLQAPAAIEQTRHILITCDWALCSSRNWSQSRVRARSKPELPSVPIMISRSPISTSGSPCSSGPPRANVDRSMSPGSRPTVVHHSSSTRFLWARVSAPPNPCQMSAYSAASRSVLRSPPPPTKIGIGRSGGGFSRFHRERMRGRASPRAAIRVPGLPN